MKLGRDAGDATHDRKLIKSQVEKRRRERMNRSLERLRTMLLQQPQQPGSAHPRVEKAEILEHTVLFLQNSPPAQQSPAGGGGQKLSFQDGFSACLQRAAQFLGPEGKGLWLGAALDSSISAHLSCSRGTQERSGVHQSTSPPPWTHQASVLQMLEQRSQHRVHVCTSNTSLHSQRLSAQQGGPKFSSGQDGQNPAAIRVEERPTTKQSPSHSLPGSQALWRPWP